MGLCCFPAYRFQILCCYSDAELFVFFHVSSVSIEVGVGCCPQTAFGGEPGHRRLAKCDAGSFVGTSSISLAPPQAAGLVHSAAPPLKIAIALLDCDFVFFAHVGATLAFPVAPHTHSLSGQKAAHSGDTRLTAANGARCGRGQGCKPFKVLPPCPLAPASARAIGRRGAPKECRDFALRFSASALKCRAALQAQGLPRLVLAASETCAARLPSAWSLSAPARCRSGCCQQSHRRSFQLFCRA